MAATSGIVLRSSWFWSLLFILLASVCKSVEAASNTDGSFQYINSNSETITLEDNRKPALYTGDFGDCQGDSVINVTRFDAAMYKDNMTVTFHIAGHTAITNESVMMYVGVYAYGESRFSLTFNPCSANIGSLCPLNASVPIEASAAIPVSQSYVDLVPSIALTVPDFEGQAILRFFSNTTQSQIACYSAVLTNGSTFSHPNAVSSVLGAFAAIALIMSILVTIHGDSVSETRKHYTHSVSVFMVFAVYHHIFFTGALSMNWPSVLVAFWSNYAWSAGMIYSSHIENTINRFLGNNLGNISMVGAAASGTSPSDFGGGYDISQIYKRGDGLGLLPRATEQLLSKRDPLANRTTGFSWYGYPVRPGLPLPGNYSGFAGTLAQEKIPVSDAFMTALLWYLSFVAGIIVLISLLKLTVELLYRIRVLKTERLGYFRQHWLAFVASGVLRSMFITFFMFMLLTLFQFNFGDSAKVLGIAGVIFTLFLLTMFGAVGYAIYCQYRAGKLILGSDNLCFEAKLKWGVIPWVGVVRKSILMEKDAHRRLIGSIPWYWFRSARRKDGEYLAHDNEKFTKNFGWLVSRYRDSRWWFPIAWLIYDLVRACFYGGAANHPLIQVFGLLVVECIAFLIFIRIRPFESTSLNIMMVYLLGISKVLTVALSSAFAVKFNQDRIILTVIGIVIIVIQGILTCCLLIAITIGSILSYMSLTRNHETFHPRRWNAWRRRFFRRVDLSATDRPAPPPPPPPPRPPVPTEPYFKVGSVTRQLKIEDEDPQLAAQYANESYTSLPLANEPPASPVRAPSRAPSRAQSVRSQTSQSNLPYGARRHRESWSTRDFEDFRLSTASPPPEEGEPGSSDLSTRRRSATMRSPVVPKLDTPTRQKRSSSLKGAAPGPIIPDSPRMISPRNSTSDFKAHRRQRSNSAAHALRNDNIDEEKEIEAK